MEEKNKKEELSFFAQIMEMSFFHSGKIKIFVSIFTVSLPALGAYWVGMDIEKDAVLISFQTLSFILLTGLTVYLFQNSLLTVWFGNLEEVKKKPSDERVERIKSKIQRKNRFYRRITMFVFLAVIVIDVGSQSSYRPHLEFVLKYPVLWLGLAAAILFQLTTSIGAIVEGARIANFRGHKDEILEAANEIKIYGHQMPEAMEQLWCPRMLAGYAVGICFLQYIHS